MRVMSSAVDYSDSDRKSTRLNSSHGYKSYAVFCLKKKMLILPLPDGYQRQPKGRGQCPFNSFRPRRNIAVEEADLCGILFADFHDAVVPEPSGHSNHIHVKRILYLEACLTHLRRQVPSRVSAVVPDGPIHAPVEELKRRNQQNQTSAWFQHGAHERES